MRVERKKGLRTHSVLPEPIESSDFTNQVLDSKKCRGYLAVEPLKWGEKSRIWRNILEGKKGEGEESYTRLFSLAVKKGLTESIKRVDEVGDFDDYVESLEVKAVESITERLRILSKKKITPQTIQAAQNGVEKDMEGFIDERAGKTGDVREIPGGLLHEVGDFRESRDWDVIDAARNALEKLPPKERKAVKSRWGVGEDQKTYIEISRDEGFIALRDNPSKGQVSTARARQLEQKGLRRLQGDMRDRKSVV